MAIERSLPGLALLPWLHQLDAGTVQGFFDVHVPLMHQAPCLFIEVSQRPDHCYLWRVADRFGSLKGEVVGFLESVRVSYWPPGQGYVVPIPVPWDLQDHSASWVQLVASFVHADVLVVDAEMCARIDVIFWPGDVCIPVATGLLLGEQFGPVEVGGVTAAQGPEHEAVTGVAAAVL